MKKKILLLMGIFSIGLLHAQVGINTTNPQGVFHIDGKGDNNQTTSVTLAQATNDLLIDTQGRVGLGTLTPTAQLSIVKNGSESPLRIVDGKVYKDAVLASDANGNVKWVDMPHPEGKVRSVMLNTTQSFPYTTHELLGDNTTQIVAEDDGLYKIILRWWGRADGHTGNTTSAQFFLASSDSGNNTWVDDQLKVKESAEYYAAASGSWYICFAMPLSGYFKKGEFIKLYIKVSSGQGSWITGTANVSNSVWLPSIVYFKI